MFSLFLPSRSPVVEVRDVAFYIHNCDIIPMKESFSGRKDIGL